MKPTIDDAIHYIAKREGISAQEVIAEMQRAIDAAYGNADPAVQARWAAMPFSGVPTPQELLAYLAEQLQSGEQD